MRTLKSVMVIAVLLALLPAAGLAQTQPWWSTAGIIRANLQDTFEKEWYYKALTGPEAGTVLTSIKKVRVRNYDPNCWGGGVLYTTATYTETRTVSNGAYYSFFGETLQNHRVSATYNFSDGSGAQFNTLNITYTDVVNSSVVVTTLSFSRFVGGGAQIDSWAAQLGIAGFPSPATTWSTGPVYSSCERDEADTYTVASTGATASCVMYIRETMKDNINVLLSHPMRNMAYDYSIKTTSDFAGEVNSKGYGLAHVQRGGSIKQMSRSPAVAPEPTEDLGFNQNNNPWDSYLYGLYPGTLVNPE